MGARLADGTRLHAVLSTIADPGTCLSLRVPAQRSFAIADWVVNGSITEPMAALLRALMASRAAFLVSGGTGSGKTTLLAGLLGLVPAGQRLLIVEDSRELAPDHPHCVRLECRAPNSEGAGAITMTDLVRQALRMRPDRLVLGEVRGGELCDLLTALNTGHEGGCGTVHANSVRDVRVGRLGTRGLSRPGGGGAAGGGASGEAARRTTQRDRIGCGATGDQRPRGDRDRRRLPGRTKTAPGTRVR